MRLCGCNERERESIDNLLLFFLLPLIWFFFLKERWKNRCVCGSGDGKELEKCRAYLFSVLFYMKDYVFIFTYCNLNAILALIVMKNIRKELVMIAAHYGDQIIANHNTKSIKISNIDSNYMKRYCF